LNHSSTAVFIGRFQPFHKYHLEVALRTLEKFDRLIFLVGSANRHRDTRNPFTAEERARTISWAMEDEGMLSRIDVIDLDDHPYDQQRWIENTQAVVGKAEPHGKVSITGHNRDASTFYLNKFPQWGLYAPQASDLGVNATAIRRAYFEGICETEKLPDATIEFLRDFSNKPEFAWLSKQYLAECAYRKQWGEGPFQCADAVVIQSGHVLAVERGGEIGEGEIALPGGHLELWETLDWCAVRECFEETCLFDTLWKDQYEASSRLLWPHFRGRERFDDPFRSPRARVITEAFLFKLPDGPLPILPPGRHDDAKRAFWLPLSKATPKAMFDDHGFIVDRMRRYL